MKVKDFVPASYNPRTISDRAMEGLRNSIERFGIVQSVVWNKRTGRVVGGHQRLKILVEKGEEETDVAVVDVDESEDTTPPSWRRWSAAWRRSGAAPARSGTPSRACPPSRGWRP
jgi:hypothetical protein